MVQQGYKYAVLADSIRKQIDQGLLKKGERLPPAKMLGERLGCNYHTVLQAYKALSREGYLELIGGSGTFVTKI